jgi:hypothetical protein
MMVTRESIEQKLDGLRKQHEQLIGQVNAVGGAIQLCEQLIKELTEQPEADKD